MRSRAGVFILILQSTRSPCATPFGQIGAATVWPRQLPPFCELSAPRIHAHCGKRLAGNEDAVRISNARRSAFKRPAALIPLEFLPLLVLFEAGIVILPPGPGAAASSRESNWSVLLRLMAGPVVFLRVMVRSPIRSLSRLGTGDETSLSDGDRSSCVRPDPA